MTDINLETPWYHLFFFVEGISLQSFFYCKKGHIVILKPLPRPFSSERYYLITTRTSTAMVIYWRQEKKRLV